MTPHRYQLLVFDWDGTLMDSEATIVHCLELAIEQLQLPSRRRDELKNIIGLGLREAVESLYPGESESFFNQFVTAYRHHFLGGHCQESALFEGVVDLLRLLQRRGYLLAIATGKGRKGLDRELERTGLGELFVTSRCADESFSKPHPQMLLDIIDFCGCEVEQTLMIGDTEYDLEMAVNAGTDSMGVSYGVHAKERLLNHNPLLIMDSLTELPQWLDSE
ncbi:HAD family hydrolase [Ectothiorhodospiraceae bacterium BW-2]|nr:HAD family hydrolase [Ectothiorhodospiraceae bacterium BW-2]